MKYFFIPIVFMLSIGTASAQKASERQEQVMGAMGLNLGCQVIIGEAQAMLDQTISINEMAKLPIDPLRKLNDQLEGQEQKLKASYLQLKKMFWAGKPSLTQGEFNKLESEVIVRVATNVMNAKKNKDSASYILDVFTSSANCVKDYEQVLTDVLTDH